MALSEKKKISNERWNKANFGTLVCKVYRADAEAFREYAASRGQSVNELLRGFVAECLGRPLERRTPAADREKEPEKLKRLE